MDLSVIGATNVPLSNAAVFADNVHDLLGTVTPRKIVMKIENIYQGKRI